MTEGTDTSSWAAGLLTRLISARDVNARVIVNDSDPFWRANATKTRTGAND